MRKNKSLTWSPGAEPFCFRRFALSTASTCCVYRGTALFVATVVALRLATGWFFVDSAMSKRQDRNFSSAGFLSQAQGPLAPLYQSKLPDLHGWNKSMAVALADKPNPYNADTEAEKWTEFNQRSYADWQDAVIHDWGRIRQRVASHYGFDESQEEQAGRIFDYYEGKLRIYLAENHEEFEGYRHLLYRIARMDESSSAEDVPFEEQRIARLRTESAAKAAELKGSIVQMEEALAQELNDLALAAQRSAQGDLPVERPLAGFDRFLIAALFAIGGCLVVGLLTRLAALGGGLFLLSVVASQPPWIVGYQTIGYQIIMMFVCFLLMAVGAGRWAGLDYFVSKCTAAVCATNKETGDA